MPTLPPRTDRHYSTESVGRAGRGRGGRSARHTWDNAGIARTLALIQRHPADDYLSSSLPATESVAFRKKESLGRHAASARASRKTNQRETTKLFSVAALYERRFSIVVAASLCRGTHGVAPARRHSAAATNLAHADDRRSRTAATVSRD